MKKWRSSLTNTFTFTTTTIGLDYQHFADATYVYDIQQVCNYWCLHIPSWNALFLLCENASICCPLIRGE